MNYESISVLEQNYYLRNMRLDDSPGNPLDYHAINVSVSAVGIVEAL